MLLSDGDPGSIGNSPAHVVNMVRQLLAADRIIEPQYPDVFEAFSPLPKANLALIAKITAGGSRAKEPKIDDVRLSLETLGRTVATLKTIQARLGEQKAQILLQLESQQQELSSQVAS